MSSLKNPCLRAVEEAYSIALNPELDYLAQLQTLARDGELASSISSKQVLFKLCMIVDAQAKEIQTLKENGVVIIREIAALKESKIDPTQTLI